MLPPPEGAGLVHVLVRDFEPVPHVLVQLEYSPHSVQSPLIGDEIAEQALVLHTIVSNEDPLQLLPPFGGAGVEQLLDLDLCPVPHVLVQPEYSPHALHSPSIGKKRFINRFFSFI